MKNFYSTFTLKLSLIVLILFVGVTGAMAQNATFKVGSNTYNNLTDAISAAGNNGIIVVASTGFLPDGKYTIPNGVKLLVPYNTSTSISTTPKSNGTWTKPTAYRTLTFSSGAEVTVQSGGAICVGGEQFSTTNKLSNNQGGPGSPVGPLGVISMKNGGKITLESGSNLYCWGFITGQNKDEGNNTNGVGSIEAQSGANVYETFVIADWHGGGATAAMTQNQNSKKIAECKVFPFNQYFIPNIEVPLTLDYGASETVLTYISSTIGVSGSVSIPFISSTDDCMFGMKANSTFKKWYDAQKDRLNFETWGNISINKINIASSGQSISSSDYILPLTNNISFTTHSGTLTVPYDVSLLPESSITIGGDVTAAVSKNVYIYDSKQWSRYGYGYYRVFYPYRLTTHYSEGENGLLTKSNNKNAQLIVNGTINVENGGNIYTTKDGADIISNGGGKIIYSSKPSSSANIYQILDHNTKGADDGLKFYYSFGAWIFKKEYSLYATQIPVTAAQLHNADGTYQSTAAAPAGTTYYYVANNNVSGAWKTTRFGYDADNSQLFLGVNDPLTADSVSAAKANIGSGLLSADLSKATGSFDVAAMRTAIGATDGNNILLYAPSNDAKANNVIVNGIAENIVIIDKQPVKVSTAFSAKNVTYTRQNTKNAGDVQWGTICLPFAVKSGNGVQYYQLENIDGNTMNFTKVDNVEANQPAIYSIASTADALTITDANAAIAASADSPVGTTIKLIGVQNSPVTLETGNTSYYYIAQNKFWQPTTNAVTVAPQRAYFQGIGNGLAKVLNIAVNDGTATGIGALNASETTATTIVAIYSVNGTRQSSLQKGINIVKMSDGSTRKIVVR